MDRSKGWCWAAVIVLCAACGGRTEFLDGELGASSAGTSSRNSGSSGTGNTHSIGSAGSSSFAGTASSFGGGTGFGGTASSFGGDSSGGDGGTPSSTTAPQSFMPPAIGSAPPGGEATNVGLDAAHDNLQPGSAVASPLARQWTATFNDTVRYPLVANQRVYVLVEGSQLTLSALRVDTGKVIWGPAIVGGGSLGLAYDQERLFSVDINGNLSAFDASTGQLLWTTPLVAQYAFSSAPVALGGKVYVNGAGEGGTTFAVDGASGKILWQADTFDGSEGSVATVGSKVYEAEACDQLSVFETASGKLDWFHEGNCTGGGGATPSVYGNWIWEFDWAEGNVILDMGGNEHGAFDADQPLAFDQGMVFYQKAGVLSAVDVASNLQRWTFTRTKTTLDTTALCFGPVAAGQNHRVFVASSEPILFEIDDASGSIISTDMLGPSTLPGALQTGCPAPLAIAENRLFVPFANFLFAY